jgi:hypothetical protein
VVGVVEGGWGDGGGGGVKAFFMVCFNLYSLLQFYRFFISDIFISKKSIILLLLLALCPKLHQF